VSFCHLERARKGFVRRRIVDRLIVRRHVDHRRAPAAAPGAHCSFHAGCRAYFRAWHFLLLLRPLLHLLRLLLLLVLRSLQLLLLVPLELLQLQLLLVLAALPASLCLQIVGPPVTPAEADPPQPLPCRDLLRFLKVAIIWVDTRAYLGTPPRRFVPIAVGAGAVNFTVFVAFRPSSNARCAVDWRRGTLAPPLRQPLQDCGAGRVGLRAQNGAGRRAAGRRLGRLRVEPATCRLGGALKQTKFTQGWSKSQAKFRSLSE
jgi:hypothetical protein